MKETREFSGSVDMETGTRYIFGSFEMDWYNSFLNIS
jgi:hypothetical protein